MKPGQRCTRPVHPRHPDRHAYDRAANANWHSVYGYTAKRCGYVEPEKIREPGANGTCTLCGCKPGAPRHRNRDLQSYHAFEAPE